MVFRHTPLFTQRRRNEAPIQESCMYVSNHILSVYVFFYVTYTNQLTALFPMLSFCFNYFFNDIELNFEQRLVIISPHSSECFSNVV